MRFPTCPQKHVYHFHTRSNKGTRKPSKAGHTDVILFVQPSSVVHLPSLIEISQECVELMVQFC